MRHVAAGVFLSFISRFAEHGIRPAEFARKAGVSNTYVSRLLRASVWNDPRWAVVKRGLLALGLDPRPLRPEEPSAEGPWEALGDAFLAKMESYPLEVYELVLEALTLPDEVRQLLRRVLAKSVKIARRIGEKKQ